MSSLSLQLEGLRCAGCTAKLQARLAALPGVLDASATFGTASARVQFDAGRVTVEELIEACDAVGVKATVAALFQPPDKKNNCCKNYNNSISQIQLRLRSKKNNLIRVITKLPQPLLDGVVGITATPRGRAVDVIVTFDTERVQPRAILTWLLTRLPADLEGAEFLPRKSSGVADEAAAAARTWALTVFPALWCVVSGMKPSWHRLVMEDGRVTSVTALAACYVWLYGGGPIVVRAIKCVLTGVYTMDLLVAISTTTTLIFSLAVALSRLNLPLFFESSAGVLLAVLTGRAVEASVRAAVISRLRCFSFSATTTDRFVVVDESGAMDIDNGQLPRSAQQCLAQKIEKCDDGGHGETVWIVPSPAINRGDLIRAGPGDTLPVDGVLEQDSPIRVDESVMSGEARAVWKGRGHLLLAGTRLLDDTALIRVQAIGSKSFLGRIQALVTEAAAAKHSSKAANLADNVAGSFVLGILLLALVTAVAWSVLVFTGLVVPNLKSTHHAFLSLDSKVLDGVPESGLLPVMEAGETINENWWLRALLFVAQFPIAVISVGCPCALGLATPLAVAAAVAAAARCGIVVRNYSVFFGAGDTVQHLVWDKTGTLTCGEMRVTRVIALPESEWGESQSQLPPPPCPRKTDDDLLLSPDQCQALALAGAAVRQSDHPVSRAIAAFCAERLPPESLPSVLSVREVTGQGILATLAGGLLVAVGRPQFCARNRESEDGSTAIAIGGRIIAELQFADPLREHAKSVVATMKKYASEQWICSGDAPAVAECLGDAVGIDVSHVHAGMLPKNKVEFVRKLKEGKKCRREVKDENNSSIELTISPCATRSLPDLEQLPCLSPESRRNSIDINSNERVLFVGDGVNDAPAMTEADIGIAVPTRLAEVVSAAADIVLLTPSLQNIPKIFRIARHADFVIRLNLFWAFAFNIIALPTAAGLFHKAVMLPPAIAGLLMAGSSCLVVAISSTLLVHGKK